MEKKDNQTAITFTKGSSYTFDEQTRLKYGVSFDQSQVSLDVSGLMKNKQKHILMTMPSLWQDGSLGAQKELAWQLHLSLSLLVLGTVALILVDYMTCRKYPTRMYMVTGCTVLLYYATLIAVRFKAGVLISLFGAHLVYTLCHVHLLVVVSLIVGCTRLVRAHR